VGDEIRGDDARSPRRGEVGREALHPVLQDRVPVAHDRRHGPGLGHRADHLEGVTNPEAGPERRVRGRLDGRPVHHRIGVLDADLDDIATIRDHRAHRLDRALDRREARRIVADQCRPPLGTTPLEHVAENTHPSTPPSTRAPSPSSSARYTSTPASGGAPPPNNPNHRAAVSTSLSPRPDTLTRITSTPSAASCAAPATACADSIAGMMPSVRHSCAKASMASESVTGRYSARPICDRWECSGPTPG